eukprot:CAMPEP_0194397656 /NCGR_PEP_ID=MMETSP0174-20130528/125665_1 /TAXON_ID=216777 /ORGANISM="Proboscia alata, Strain PI-D3" /LENGTH=971 /DNA_ID=CAMNT_0039193857 /DNA_START=24 /DNA_END=2940 /DNA_ORIENTATION=-
MKALVLFTAIFSFVASDPIEPNVAPFDYMNEGDKLQGFLSVPDVTPAPVVIILPDWDGVNLYEKQRATMIAKELGYVAFAADIYGADLHEVVEFSERIELSTKYRSNNALYISRIKAAIDLMKSSDLVISDKIAVIGYCFGGTGVITYALSGESDAAALVSLHGGLTDFVVGPEVKPKLLVLSGGADDTATDIMKLEDTLNVANATWEITRYSGIKHGFTAFESGAYNKWADERSWKSMSFFLQEALGDVAFAGKIPAAESVETIDYTDVDGALLRGYLSIPEMGSSAKVPAVIIFPDWDGVNQYEKLRATSLSGVGYVAFAADIYGKDLQEDLPFDTRREQATLYRSNQALYVQRMQTAIDLVKARDDVDINKIAIIGYCFGGTGVVTYAFSGAEDAKIAVAFHGGLTSLPSPSPEIKSHILILSGGDDDAHGNQTELEMHFNEGNADWEITRYADVVHGFTSWTSGGYNLLADARSWESMLTEFERIFNMDGSGTVVDVATEAGIFNTLLAAAAGAGLVDTLSNPDATLTVLAPSDAAFEGIDVMTLVSDLEALKTLLLNHVLDTEVYSKDLSNGQVVTMLGGGEVTVMIADGKVMLNNAMVVSPDVMASNGVIHVLDALIDFSDDNIVNVASANGNFGTLLAAANAAGLVDTLSNPDATLTVFAPSDAAFEGIDVMTLVSDLEALKTLLLNHVLDTEVYSKDLSNGQVVTMLGGGEVTVLIADGKVMLNNAVVVSPDVMASNGVIHVLDKLIDFSVDNIVNVASANGNFGTLLAAANAAGLVDTLSNPDANYTIVDVATANGSFGTLLTAATAAGLVDTLSDPDATLTVFAPTDEAFEGVDVAALLKDTGALKAILLNHVLGSVVMSTDLTDDQEVTMLGGGKLTVKIDGGTVMVNNAKVTGADVKATNGVIHVIDSVITFDAKVVDDKNEKVEDPTDKVKPNEDESSTSACSLAPIVLIAMISMIVV